METKNNILGKLKRSIATCQLAVIGLVGLSLTACTSSDIDDAAQTTPLKILPLSSPSFVEINSTTRTDANLPSGYVWYNELTASTNPVYANIGMFMTPDYTNPMSDYIYQETDEQGRPINSWKSTISVETGSKYYMYGFMPRQGAESATISPLNSDYAKGAVLHLNDFKTLTPADVCVVVGVRKATADEITARAAQSAIPLGKFTYIGGSEGDNAAFVLLKHIYSGLHFRAMIDPEYHKLRDIKFTKVELIAKNMQPTVDIDVTITANDTGADPLTSVDYSNYADETENKIDLFPWEGSATEYELKEEEPNMFLGCFTPGKLKEFVIRTTYNVYDKSGNEIREGCVAENKINTNIVPGLADIQAGQAYTITCTVKPTYLYVLSEPDLNNPTIELSVEG